MPAVPKATLFQSNTDSFPNNTAGEITPADLRDFNDSMITSLVDEIPFGTYTASVNTSISNLNTYTASQQPTYTALNSFTASQLTINTGVNAFTQSANASINRLDTFSSSFNTYTASINQIQSNGVVLGTSTRFNLVGSTTYFSASLVQNVGGPIATLTFTSDDGKVNTSSFNPFSSSVNTFTASANISITSLNAQTASLLTFTASAKISIDALNAYTQSDASSIINLNSFTASQNTQNTTLAQYTGSISTFTASVNTSITNLNLATASLQTQLTTLANKTGSYATTGSNSFLGNQFITGSSTFTGSVSITGSIYGNTNNLTITSNTASLDLSKGNFFTLTLVSGSTTQLAASNIKAGQTINLFVYQPSVGFGSLSYNTTFAFPLTNPYSATTNSSSVDILTFVTIDSSKIYSTAVKNLV